MRIFVLISHLFMLDMVQAALLLQPQCTAALPAIYSFVERFGRILTKGMYFRGCLCVVFFSLLLPPLSLLFLSLLLFLILLF